MPDVRIPDSVKEIIHRQPERKWPLLLSFNKTTLLLIKEALEKRRNSLRKPKLRP